MTWLTQVWNKQLGFVLCWTYLLLLIISSSIWPFSLYLYPCLCQILVANSYSFHLVLLLTFKLFPSLCLRHVHPGEHQQMVHPGSCYGLPNSKFVPSNYRCRFCGLLLTSYHTSGNWWLLACGQRSQSAHHTVGLMPINSWLISTCKFHWCKPHIVYKVFWQEETWRILSWACSWLGWALASVALTCDVAMSHQQ